MLQNMSVRLRGEHCITDQKPKEETIFLGGHCACMNSEHMQIKLMMNFFTTFTYSDIISSIVLRTILTGPGYLLEMHVQYIRGYSERMRGMHYMYVCLFVGASTN